MSVISVCTQAEDKEVLELCPHLPDGQDGWVVGIPGYRPSCILWGGVPDIRALPRVGAIYFKVVGLTAI